MLIERNGQLSAQLKQLQASSQSSDAQTRDMRTQLESAQRRARDLEEAMQRARMLTESVQRERDGLKKLLDSYAQQASVTVSSAVELLNTAEVVDQLKAALAHAAALEQTLADRNALLEQLQANPAQPLARY